MPGNGHSKICEEVINRIKKRIFSDFPLSPSNAAIEIEIAGMKIYRYPSKDKAVVVMVQLHLETNNVEKMKRTSIHQCSSNESEIDFDFLDFLERNMLLEESMFSSRKKWSS